MLISSVRKPISFRSNCTISNKMWRWKEEEEGKGEAHLQGKLPIPTTANYAHSHNTHPGGTCSQISVDTEGVCEGKRAGFYAEHLNALGKHWRQIAHFAYFAVSGKLPFPTFVVHFDDHK